MHAHYIMSAAVTFVGIGLYTSEASFAEVYEFIICQANES